MRHVLQIAIVAFLLGFAAGSALFFHRGGQAPDRNATALPHGQESDWNTTAVQARFQETIGDYKSPVVFHKYLLTNNSSVDFEAKEHSPEIKVMGRRKSSTVLDPVTGYRLLDSIFVPAHASSLVLVEDRSAFVGDADGFVVFDQRNRFRIDFPAPSTHQRDKKLSDSRSTRRLVPEVSPRPLPEITRIPRSGMRGKTDSTIGV